MAVLSSHFLNAVDGTHASAVTVSLMSISDDGQRKTLFTAESDAHGRFSHGFDAVNGQSYEMVIASGAYFKTANLPRSGAQILDEIVVRFTTPDPDSRYHIPVIMAPNSYSCWWSA